MLRLGRISYTNVLPVYAAFDAGAVACPATVVSDVPSALNAMLLNGELDVSPVSAFAWAQQAGDLALLPELCVGARREVWSVVCVSPTPLHELGGAQIAVTPDSASGRNLLRILLERRYGVRAMLREHADAFGAAAHNQPALLIGDRALDARQTFDRSAVHDLAAAWHAWTSQDMVFAVWAVRRDVLERRPRELGALLDALIAARQWGTDNPAAVVAAAQRAHARPADFYGAYYRALNFTFDERARSGLARYLAELVELGALARTPHVRPETLLAAR